MRTFAAALILFLTRGDALAQSAHDRLAAVPDLQLHGQEQIAMLLYPGFTALDLVGPHYMFACMMGATVHLVTPANTLRRVRAILASRSRRRRACATALAIWIFCLRPAA